MTKEAVTGVLRLIRVVGAGRRAVKQALERKKEPCYQVAREEVNRAQANGRGGVLIFTEGNRVKVVGGHVSFAPDIGRDQLTNERLTTIELVEDGSGNEFIEPFNWEGGLEAYLNRIEATDVSIIDVPPGKGIPFPVFHVLGSARLQPVTDLLEELKI